MRAGDFREDLFYRLSVVSIRVPALRERTEDIPELVRYFLRRYGREFGSESPSIQTDAVDFFLRQQWPGNIRELENTVRKRLLQSRGFAITLDHAQASLASYTRTPIANPSGLREFVSSVLEETREEDSKDAHPRSIRELEMELLRQALEMAKGNQSQAARWLGISRLTLREKLHHFGLHPASRKVGSTLQSPQKTAGRHRF